MNGLRGAHERAYDIHGIGLVVQSESEEAIEAIDRRLLSFAGPAVLPQLRLEFLVRRSGRPSRWSPPATPGRPVYEAAGGEILYEPGSDVLHADLAGVRLRCDAGAGVARIESMDFTGRRLYLATHPLATICLIEMLKRRGRFNLHAACLADRDRGVLLAGPSGAGKSTLAIALARSGLALLSDDMTYIARTPAGIEMLAFPDALGITERTAARFPELSTLLAGHAPVGFPKQLVPAAAVVGADDAQVWRCRPRLLVFPEIVADGPSCLAELDAGAALRRLVPDLLLTDPSMAQAQLDAFTELLAQVGCRVLRSGPDVLASAGLIRDALAHEPERPMPRLASQHRPRPARTRA